MASLHPEYADAFTKDNEAWEEEIVKQCSF